MIAPTFVQSAVASASSTTVSTAFGSNNVAGNSGFAFCNCIATLPNKVFDTNNNTWVLIGSLVDNADAEYLAVYWCQSLKAGANTITFTVPSGASNELYVVETTRAQIDSVLGFVTGDTNGSPSATAAVGPATTGAQNQLVFGYCITAGAVSTAGAGWTIDTHSPTGLGTGLERMTVGGIQPVAGSFTMSASTSWAMAMFAISTPNVLVFDRPTGQLVVCTQPTAWRCPPDVRSIVAIGFGGGGSGGGGATSGNSGGGGGGSVERAQGITVAPGIVYAALPGSGGVAAAAGANGNPGSDTTFTGPAGASSVAIDGTWSGASGGQAGNVGSAIGGRCFKATGGGNAYGLGTLASLPQDIAEGGSSVATPSQTAGSRNVVGGFDGGAAGANDAGAGGGGGGGAGPEGVGGPGGNAVAASAGTTGASPLPNTGAGSGGGGGSATAGAPSAAAASGKLTLVYASRFTPTLPVTLSVAHPSLWLRSDMGVTVGSGTVSQWLDVSGGGAAFAQATPANQPSYALNTYNGQPTISASTGGGNRTLSSTNTTAPGTSATLVMVFTPSSAASCYLCSSSNFQEIAIIENYAAGLLEWFNGNGADRYTLMTGAVYGALHQLIISQVDGVSFAAYVDGVQVVSAVPTQTINVALAEIFGASSGTGTNGDIIEVIQYPVGGIGPADVAKLHAYSQAFWGSP